MVDPRAFSYRVKVLRGSSHTPGGFLQIFGRCFPTYTHIIRFEYEVNRMDSTIFCHECNGVFVLQFFRSSWAMTSKALPPLFVEVPGPRRDRFLCVISGNRLSLGSNHCITASKLQNSALCVVAPANDLSERSRPPSSCWSSNKWTFWVVVSKSQHKTTFTNPLDSVFQTSCHSPV